MKDEHMLRMARSRTHGTPLAPGALPVAANDNNHCASYVSTGRSWAPPLRTAEPEPDSVLAWPALERLVKRRDESRVRALLRWRDLHEPHHDDQCAGRREGERPEGGWDFDAALEIRPRESELMRAVADAFRPRVVTAADGTMTRAGMGFEAERRQRQDESRVQLGALVFNGNRLLEWAETRKGAKLRPIERAGKPPKDAPKLGRSITDVRRYLFDTKPTTPSPMATTSLHRPFSGEKRGDAWKPTEQATAARAVLEAANDNTPQMPPVTHYPDAIAKGSHWLGGRVAKGKGSGSEVHAEGPSQHATESELHRLAEARRLRSLLDVPARSGSPLTLAGVLDKAITDATAADIGFACGLAPSSAEKYGTQIVEGALDAFIEIENINDANKLAA